jgi:predicted tellurium resistance membrane protein TerC
MVRTMAILMIVIGVALILRTLPHFGVGIVLGALFLAAGVGRLVMLRRKR